MAASEIPREFDELSTSEKIEYVQQLWDRIADEVNSADLTDEQCEEHDLHSICVPPQSLPRQ